MGIAVMKCPNCKVDNDRVIDTRTNDDRTIIRRRRECLKCGRRYSTYERYEPITLKVIKKCNVREPFEREKIRRGLEKACWKRPISHAQIETVVNSIECEVTDQFDVEVDSHSLGQIVMTHLKKLDQVAYVRFASVYRQFKDVRDFVDELQPILLEQSEAYASRAAEEAKPGGGT
jgi:transcriptional repressor NrdR